MGRCPPDNITVFNKAYDLTHQVEGECIYVSEDSDIVFEIKYVDWPHVTDIFFILGDENKRLDILGGSNPLGIQFLFNAEEVLSQLQEDKILELFSKTNFTAPDYIKFFNGVTYKKRYDNAMHWGGRRVEYSSAESIIEIQIDYKSWPNVTSINLWIPGRGGAINLRIKEDVDGCKNIADINELFTEGLMVAALSLPKDVFSIDVGST